MVSLSLSLCFCFFYAKDKVSSYKNAFKAIKKKNTIDNFVVILYISLLHKDKLHSIFIHQYIYHFESEYFSHSPIYSSWIVGEVYYLLFLFFCAHGL